MSSTFQVYHFTPLFTDYFMHDDGGLAVISASWAARAEFEKVATVFCEDLNDVFRLTNHIDRAWTTNPNVVPEGYEHRSTSVGDVIVDDDSVAWYVAPSGFKRIDTDAEPKQIHEKCDRCDGTREASNRCGCRFGWKSNR